MHHWRVVCSAAVFCHMMPLCSCVALGFSSTQPSLMNAWKSKEWKLASSLPYILNANKEASQTQEKGKQPKYMPTNGTAKASNQMHSCLFSALTCFSLCCPTLPLHPHCKWHLSHYRRGSPIWSPGPFWSSLQSFWRPPSLTQEASYLRPRRPLRAAPCWTLQSPSLSPAWWVRLPWREVSRLQLDRRQSQPDQRWGPSLSYRCLPPWPCCLLTSGERASSLCRNCCWLHLTGRKQTVQMVRVD